MAFSLQWSLISTIIREASFSRSSSTTRSPEPEWYFSEELEFEVSDTAALTHCIDLFRNSSVLLTRFRPEQLEQVLGGKFDLPRYIMDERISWQLSRECVLAMVDVYRQLFSEDPLESIGHMWWDLVITPYQRRDLALEETMLEALSSILKIDSLECQKAALHALGHLESDAKKAVIETYLKENPHLDLDTQSYAEAALEGRVQ